MLTFTTASSGMMLATEPAWNAPTVSTPNAAASFSRLITVLDVADEVRTDGDGVDRGAGHRAVAAAAVEGDLVAVGSRAGGARAQVDGSGRLIADVGGEAVVELGEPFEQTVLEHRAGAGEPFFGGLGDEQERCRATGPQSATRASAAPVHQAICRS